MTMSRKILFGVVAAVVLLAVAAWFLLRPTEAKHTPDELSGKWPTMVEAKTETIPAFAIAKPIGWAANEAPTAAAGLQVTRFAQGLDHPRTMLVLPNGDVIVAETNSPPRSGGGITGFFERLLMKRAGAGAPSPDALVLLRDSDGDGRADQRSVLRQGNGLSSPSGLAWANGKLYVANHDAVLAFDFQPGQTTLTGTPRKIADLAPAGRHWMRGLVVSPDGKLLYISVGSSSNIGENGMDAEHRRAAILELDLTTGRLREYASGLRNPNAMAWNQSTGELWTVVNERDQLGPDTPPDYLTNVPIGAQYGWPWFYWKTYEDKRVSAPIPDYIEEYIRKPEYGLGAHTAPLGVAFVAEGARLGGGFASGAVIARHGSWNRKPAAGYDVVFVPFDGNGNPLAKPLPLLGGFLTRDGKTHGRPTWVAFAKDGALLVTDDTAGIVWRVIAPGAAPAPAVKPVVTKHLEPVKELKGDPGAGTQASFRDDPAKP
ncbi:PQQ-dependent sugar dehydrogenase [Parablastomonas sp. CN1-191]|uniref:PQQ-dependent sugar dehydrogenase n=1 Tax=Parablastomonas sp. CN1-191 TaxID=3400908 RepID=UPI003BF7E817